MPIYSGRFDQYEEDETIMIDFFYSLLIQFDGDQGVLTFEDQTKSGIDCKPHYHFVFITEETSHDKIRRWMSLNPAMRGTRASLKQTNDYEKALIYILKQYPRQLYVPFSDLTEEELNEYIKISQAYNKNLKLNVWKDHLDLIIQQLEQKYKHEPSRLTIFEHLGEYVYDYNNDPENEKMITIPTNIKPSIVYIEQKLLPRKSFMQRFLLDHNSLIYEHDIKEYCSKTKVTRHLNGKISDHFLDSESEDY